jgi:hypothetical protein
MTNDLLPTFRFLVTYAQSGGESVVGVNASYFQQDGKFVLFKDPFHNVVFAVHTDAMLCAVREGVLG